MRWSEHQQALLHEMGLRLWWPAGPNGAATAAPAALSEPPAAAAVPARPPALAAAPPPARPDTVPADAPPTPAAPRPQPPAAAPRPAPITVAAPAGAAASAVAAMDWPALRDAVAACQACALGQTRRHTVFGVGHVQAHCMVVGEAPGEQEDQRGEPFVGPAGQLLDRMLAALGLSREAGGAGAAADPARQVFIANTLKCRPPRNRNPSAEELATCQPFLERQVALVQPRVILAMGRFAVQSLLGSDEPIGRLRGRVHHWHGVPLVVTYHPAYLLRQPADKARAWDDLCLAATCLAQAPA